MSEYFSDRELGPPPRVLDELPETAWGGIVAAFYRAVDGQKFGRSFPEQCPDGDGICGTSIANMTASLRADIPGIAWPLQTESNPGTLVAMDLVEFSWRHIAQPNSIDYHSFFRHDHYRFDVAAGRSEWRDEINRILARNGVALELARSGEVVRIGPPSAEAALQQTIPATGDGTLDRLLETAIRKYRSPDPSTRREALEPLWDALERIKTILDHDKKRGVALLIERTTSDGPAQSVLNDEFEQLTRIGNDFQIRHHETTKIPVAPEMVDYLFVRAYTLLDSAARALTR
jgi:hypothetical protein